MAHEENMNFLAFHKRFATDDACREHLYRTRWPKGLVCRKCGEQDLYKHSTRHIYECKCGHHVRLTFGTIMHRSRTSLTKWFLAIYLAIHDKKNVSTLRLKEELKISYHTAWSMLHKIRWAMGDRDNAKLLTALVAMEATNKGDVGKA